MKIAKMWYLTDKCSDLKTLIPKGDIHTHISHLELQRSQFEPSFIQSCCTHMNDGL